MKTYIVSTLALLAFVAAGTTAATAGECSNASIQGHYTYWLQGFDEAGKPYAEAGQEHFDGAGHVKTISGVAGAAAPEADEGTYKVNDDCTGEVTYKSGAHDKIFVAPSGDSFTFSSAKQGVVQVGEDTRVDKE